MKRNAILDLSLYFAGTSLFSGFNNCKHTFPGALFNFMKFVFQGKNSLPLVKDVKSCFFKQRIHFCCGMKICMFVKLICQFSLIILLAESGSTINESNHE